MCKTHMKTPSGVISCSNMRDKGFLLKTYLENHKHKVDGNTSACLSNIDTICQNSNQGYREENTWDQTKLNIATSAISMYASRMLCLKMKAVDTTNLWCPAKRDYKIYTQH